jgi:glycosyltransferase involved in cell wall biosynthesis
MDDHAEVPIVLLGSDVNRGLPASRNLAVSAARAERIMVMDADNTVYPNCLRRLSDALDADPTAAFAYATLEAFGAHPGLRSELGWSPRWLCEANYIDAQAMVRRATYDRHGGYREDDDFAYGWEDWELWLRLAEAGEHGVHVPQMLGRYRTQASSMITITNLVADEMRAHIRGLHPTLPWPEHDRA